MSRYNYRGGQKSMTLEQEKDNIYLNIVINGNTPKYNPNPALPPTGEEDVFAEFNVVKSEPYLDKPSDYYCAVIRYVIPLQSVPIFIMPIIPNQPNPDLSTMLFGMIYLGTRYPKYVQYFPDNTLTAPVQNQPDQVITPYYYVYSYSHLIQNVNLDLASIWVTSGLSVDFPAQLASIFYV